MASRTTQPELSPKILYNQFVLSCVRRSDLPDWTEREYAGWVLQTHPTLPVSEVVTSTGAFGGWLLGFPLTAERLLARGSTLPCPARADDPFLRYQEVFEDLAGRWLAIVFASGTARVYPDANATLSALYSLEEPLVCSTPSVIGKGPGAEDWDDDLARRIPRGWYPYGLTPHKSLRRLLPNHYLDLEQGQIRRYWPRAEDMLPVEDTGVVLERVVQILSRIVATAVRAGAYMTLTAGHDTRMLLACSRPVAQEAIYFTSTAQRLDVQTASELARRLHLQHIVVEERRTTASERRQRSYLSGYAGDPLTQHLIGNHRSQLQASCLQVTGNGGHITRDAAKGDDLPELTPEALVKYVNMPPLLAILAGAASWLDSLPVCENHQIRDLSWLEQPLAAGAGPDQYAFDYLTLSTVDGYAHRVSNGLILRLPLAYRVSGDFFRDICRRTWPQTLDVPINQPRGIARLATYPDRVERKLRRTVRSWVRSVR